LGESALDILKLVVLAVVAVGAALPGRAETFAPGSLPYDPVKASCQEIVAHANDNRAAKFMAASLYAHGKHMGKSCFAPDFVRAFELWTELGDWASMQSVLKDLEARANSGNPRAESHLKKLKAAGYIEKVVGRDPANR
jgi:hypothetical protein